MTDIFSTKGMKISIGGTMAAGQHDAVDFAAQTWIEIGGTSNLGSIGDTSELISFQQVAEGRVRKLKGTRNAGTVELVCGHDPDDPGQIALRDAEGTDSNYAFKIELSDAPEGGTPSTRYFVALVMSATETYDEANSVTTLNTTLEVNSNLASVTASVSGAAPDNTVLPAITGTAEVGETLTSTTGTWTGSPTPTYARQWFANGEGLAGQTGTTLVLTGAHEGKVISVLVTATNYHGARYAMSAATSAVAA